MTTDPSIREQSYAYFRQEAPELLRVLEQELLNLRENYSITKVHTLMRATHTLKGAAASMGLESIKTVAHSLEDIFKTLCQPHITIDAEIEALLFEGYECLRVPLMAELTGSHSNDAEVFNQAAAVFTRLQEKLGNCFDREAYIPTSAELGFDIAQSIFEVGITQRLEQIAEAIASDQPQVVASTLQIQAEVFLGVAESLNLSGFKAIAEVAIAALAKYPESAIAIAQLALADFQQGQAAVLAGDRISGGQPCEAWQQFLEEDSPAEVEDIDLLLESIWDISESLDLPTDESEQVSEQESFLTTHAEVVTSSESLEDVDLIPQVPTPKQIPKKDAKPLSDTVRVNVEHLERLNYLIGELLTNQNRQTLQDEQLQGGMQDLFSHLAQHQQILNQLREWSDRILIAAEQQNRPAFTSSTFNSLELDHYRQLKQLVQSLSTNATQLEAATNLVEAFSLQSSQILTKQNRLLTNVRDDLLAARMVPLGDIFNRLPRVLQQLETLANKSVTLKLSGSEILVDKAVSEKLYDPLLHLVRNAFDHGIESLAVRQQKGKPQKGQIEIRAFHQGSHLMIEVRDDGQGLKFAQIRQQAIELNLVSPEEAGNLTEAQLMDLLFEPGFSTAEQVNNLSGRGIGLDVVRAQLQALQGAVTVYSELNRGTTFLLQIPFSLTMAKLFLCQAGGTTYALLTDAIEQVITPQPEQMRQWEGGKVLQWGEGTDERLIPVCQLEQILNYCSPITAPLTALQPEQNSGVTTEQVTRIVLLRHQEQLLGLQVDQIIGEQESVIRPLGAIIVPPRYVYGGSILADGRLTLVIDGAALVKHVSEQQSRNVQLLANRYETLISFTPSILSAEGQRAQLPEQVITSKKLLLVDDSLTLRQTLALTLQKQGYEVLQASNGYAAIEQMRSQVGIHLVICDLEMPQMNGFEFLNYRRQNPVWAQIPVVILTSQTGEQQRLITMELGATAYITKPYLEPELLATVADLLAES